MEIELFFCKNKHSYDNLTYLVTKLDDFIDASQFCFSGC